MPSQRAAWKGERAVLALCLLATLAGAGVDNVIKEDLGVSGSLRGAYFSDDRSFNEVRHFGVVSAWIMARPKEFPDGTRTYLDFRIQNQNATRSRHFDAEVKEAYAEKSIGRYDLKAGRQITVWGRADKINPTDVWSVRDLRLLAPEDEDQRLGILSFQGTFNAGSSRLIILWQPEWRAPGIPSAEPVNGLTPGAPWKQTGWKWDRSGERVDFSVSVSHVLDRVPDLRVDSFQGPRLDFRFIDVAGADFSAPIGSFGLRGEIAYTWTTDRSGEDPLRKNSGLFAVLGIERTFGGDLNANAQYFSKRITDFRDPASIPDPDLRRAAGQVSLASNQLHENEHGVSLRIGHKALNETLETELTGAHFFGSGDSFLRPKMAYSITDNFKAVLGAEYYEGPAHTVFGRLAEISTGYLELRIYF